MKVHCYSGATTLLVFVCCIVAAFEGRAQEQPENLEAPAGTEGDGATESVGGGALESEGEGSPETAGEEPFESGGEATAAPEAEEEKAEEDSADCEECDCDEQEVVVEKNPRYIIDRKGSAIIGGWFGLEVTFGSLGFDAGAFTGGVTGGIELFGRVGIGVDLGILTSMGDGPMDGWTTDDSMAGGYAGGIVSIVFINRKFFSWGLDTKLDAALLCRVNDNEEGDSAERCKEATAGFLLDPRFSFAFRLTRRFRFKVLTGYRLGFFDDDWTGPSKGGFGTIYGGLSLEFGKF